MCIILWHSSEKEVRQCRYHGYQLYQSREHNSRGNRCWLLCVFQSTINFPCVSLLELPAYEGLTVCA